MEQSLKNYTWAYAGANTGIHIQWGVYSFSWLFLLNVTTLSQKDHKLFSATYNLCSKKIGNKKIEGSHWACMCHNLWHTVIWARNYFMLWFNVGKFIESTISITHNCQSPSNQGILSIPGIADYKWVPARIGSFWK